MPYQLKFIGCFHKTVVCPVILAVRLFQESSKPLVEDRGSALPPRPLGDFSQRELVQPHNFIGYEVHGSAAGVAHYKLLALAELAESDVLQCIDGCGLLNLRQGPILAADRRWTHRLRNDIRRLRAAESSLLSGSLRRLLRLVRPDRRNGNHVFDWGRGHDGGR